MNPSSNYTKTSPKSHQKQLVLNFQGTNQKNIIKKCLLTP